MNLLKEPLLHFLLLGAALFAAYGFVSREDDADPQGITVSAGHIEHLAFTFAKVWQRPPSRAELKAQIDQYVKEEMLSREAIALGLDKNDTVIRRRLQQKMEFLSEDVAATVEPTEAELAAYLARRAQDFAEDRRFTFQQIYLNPEKRGAALEADAAALLAALTAPGAGADTSALGDSTLLPQDFADESQPEVAARFGSAFAASLATIDPGAWVGPIRSGFGAHLVRVTQRTEGSVPGLDEVRDVVKRELLNERRLEANQRFMAALLAKYAVTVEWPADEAGAAPKDAASATTTATTP